MIRERLDGVPTTLRYAFLLVVGHAMLLAIGDLLSVIVQLRRAHGGTSGAEAGALILLLLLPIPLAMGAAAWLMTAGRRGAWLVVIGYELLVGLLSMAALMSSFTTLVSFALATGSLVLLLLSPSRGFFTRKPGASAAPPPPG
ncbi:MAG: hypothetical protein ACYDGR_10875 [Candidatus Dormibacteria bacterium]